MRKVSRLVWLGAASLQVNGCEVFRSGDPASTDSPARVAWHVRGAGNNGLPAFDGYTAFFLDRSHQLHAIDGTTGVLRWQATIDSTPGGTYGVAGCATVADVVVCGDEDLIAVHRTDGSPAWRYHAVEGYSPGYFYPAASGNTIYAGSPSGTMYAIDATTGKPRWVRHVFPAQPELVSIFDPVVDEDIVVAGFTIFSRPAVGGVVAFDAMTGQTRWVSTFPASANGAGTNGRSTALWRDLVLAPSASGTIFALDRLSGTAKWSLPGVGTSPSSGRVITTDWRAVIALGTTLYAGSLTGWFVAYDLTTHSEKWRLSSNTGGANVARLVTDGQAVFVLTVSGDLVAYSATRPAVLWRLGSIENAFYTTVALGADRVFASRTDGFYAIRK